MILAIKRTRKSRKFVLYIESIIHAQPKTYFAKFQYCKLYDQTYKLLLCKSLVVQLVYYGQNIKVSNKKKNELSSCCYFLIRKICF